MFWIKISFFQAPKLLVCNFSPLFFFCCSNEPLKPREKTLSWRLGASSIWPSWPLVVPGPRSRRKSGTRRASNRSRQNEKVLLTKGIHPLLSQGLWLRRLMTRISRSRIQTWSFEWFHSFSVHPTFFSRLFPDFLPWIFGRVIAPNRILLPGCAITLCLAHGFSYSDPKRPSDSGRIVWSRLCYFCAFNSLNIFRLTSIVFICELFTRELNAFSWFPKSLNNGKSHEYNLKKTVQDHSKELFLKLLPVIEREGIERQSDRVNTKYERGAEKERKRDEEKENMLEVMKMSMRKLEITAA